MQQASRIKKKYQNEQIYQENQKLHRRLKEIHTRSTLIKGGGLRSLGIINGSVRTSVTGGSSSITAILMEAQESERQMMEARRRAHLILQKQTNYIYKQNLRNYAQGLDIEQN